MDSIRDATMDAIRDAIRAGCPPQHGKHGKHGKHGICLASMEKVMFFSN